jgi:hypothetical protein
VFLLMVGQGKNTGQGSAEIEAKPERPAFAVHHLSCSTGPGPCRFPNVALSAFHEVRHSKQCSSNTKYTPYWGCAARPYLLPYA